MNIKLSLSSQPALCIAECFKRFGTEHEL